MVATHSPRLATLLPQQDHAEQLTAAPVFIVGSPRSGTTWLQRILLSHPQLCGGQESHFFIAASSFFRSFDRLLEPAGSKRVTGIPAYWERSELDAAMRTLWQQTMRPLAAKFPNAKILVEKTPDHAVQIPLIRELLPQARFIHMIRDSRAVVASMLAGAKTWACAWAPKTAREAAEYWAKHVKMARGDGRKLGADYTEIYYEDLSADPLRESRRMFDFLGINVEPQQLAKIVESQRFDEQKAINGSPLAVVVEAARRAEPAGFFRSGKTDSWRKDLSLYQKLTVWRHTRYLMADLGYTWSGRTPTTGRA